MIWRRRTWVILEQSEDVIGVAVLAVMFVVVVASVVFRYALNDSLTWSEELARFGLIAITFIGTGTGFRKDTHIRIDLADMLPAVFAKPVRILVLLISLAVVSYLTVMALWMMPVLANSESAALGLSLSYLYGIVAAGLGVGVARIVVALLKAVAGKQGA